jgi:hypothetical protein
MDEKKFCEHEFFTFDHGDRVCTDDGCRVCGRGEWKAVSRDEVDEHTAYDFSTR